LDSAELTSSRHLLLSFTSDETRFFLASIFLRVVQEIQPPKHLDMVQLQCSFGKLKT
jgi:hypothetical protein